MKRYYDSASDRIVWIDQEATPDFWDDRWDGSDTERKSNGPSTGELVSDN